MSEHTAQKRDRAEPAVVERLPPLRMVDGPEELGCPVCCAAVLTCPAGGAVASLACLRCDYVLDGSASGVGAADLRRRIQSAVSAHGCAVTPGECGAAPGQAKFSTAGPLGPEFLATGVPAPTTIVASGEDAFAVAEVAVVWRPLLPAAVPGSGRVDDAPTLLWVRCGHCGTVDVVV